MTDYLVEITFETPTELAPGLFSPTGARNTYQICAVATSAYASSAYAGVEARMARTLHASGTPKYETIAVEIRRADVKGEQG